MILHCDCSSELGAVVPVLESAQMLLTFNGSQWMETKSVVFESYTCNHE